MCGLQCAAFMTNLFEGEKRYRLFSVSLSSNRRAEWAMKRRICCKTVIPVGWLGTSKDYLGEDAEGIAIELFVTSVGRFLAQPDNVVARRDETGGDAHINDPLTGERTTCESIYTLNQSSLDSFDGDRKWSAAIIFKSQTESYPRSLRSREGLGFVAAAADQARGQFYSELLQTRSGVLSQGFCWSILCRWRGFGSRG